MAGPADSPDERDAIELSGAILYRMAYGLASDLAEARSHCLASRLHDAPRAGGDAAEVLEEVRRRLAVGPERPGADGELRRPGARA
ncbi:MAG: hypothetical protein JO252_12660 [Planctomycetaceae bacterium]|nr:hypothetical protein [Planctomycetaceae bacterium]